MRSERLHERGQARTAALAGLSIVALAGLAAGCDEAPAPAGGATGSRFEAVKSTKAAAAAGTFCEKSFPKGARKFVAAPLRDAPAPAKEAAVAGRWTWVNVWATWCEPCKDEMGLLGKWKDGIATDGKPINLELLSIDAPEAEGALKTAIGKGLPGRVSWIRSEEDFPAFLEGLGVDKSAAIPIHALVDPEGSLRCVRVGAIHDRDYGTVRTLLAGG